MTIETMTELDRRINDGIDVRLLWNPEDGRVFVAVDDAKTGEAFSVEVRERDKALEVFHHPFAYAAWHEAAPEPLAA
jgi:hypothetical protein